MARPQSADYPERRAAMLDRAAELFARQGYRGTSMAALAAACGVSKSLLYHYFGAKDDLLEAVMADHVEALARAAAKVMAGPGTPAERLDALVHAFLRLYAGAAARQRVLLNELGELAPARRAAIVAKQRVLIATVEALLADLAPALTGPRRRAAAMLVFGMINWTHTWWDPAGAVGPDGLADLAAAIALSGLVQAS